MTHLVCCMYLIVVLVAVVVMSPVLVAVLEKVVACLKKDLSSKS